MGIGEAPGRGPNGLSLIPSVCRDCEGPTVAGLSQSSELDILVVVTKRLIEVDDDKLAAVRALLGTRTLKATVDGALTEVLALDQRRRGLLAEHGVDEAMLADLEARRAAWG
jgi:Arc/MetJ family transcription regulator